MYLEPGNVSSGCKCRYPAVGELLTTPLDRFEGSRRGGGNKGEREGRVKVWFIPLAHVRGVCR